MGNLCEVNNFLLAPNGEDFSMVKESERKSNYLSRLTYTLQVKMILRQFEGAAGQQSTSACFFRIRSTLGAIYFS